MPDFLKGDGTVKDYLQDVNNAADNYNGFNLLVGKLSLTEESRVGWYCNIEERVITMLRPGIHVLSNKVLNCPWPTMVYGKERFGNILNEASTKQELIDKLIEMLNMRER